MFLVCLIFVVISVPSAHAYDLEDGTWTLVQTLTLEVGVHHTDKTGDFVAGIDETEGEYVTTISGNTIKAAWWAHSMEPPDYDVEGTDYVVGFIFDNNHWGDPTMVGHTSAEMEWPEWPEGGGKVRHDWEWYANTDGIERLLKADGWNVEWWVRYVSNIRTEDCTNGIDDDGDGLIDYDDPDCCEGVVPGLLNHEVNNLYSRDSVIEAINAIIQGGLIGRYIDVDITAWISDDTCCEKVEGNFTVPTSLQPELGTIELIRVASGVHNREIAFQGANFILHVLSMFIQGTDITGAYIDTEPSVVLDGFIINDKTGGKNYAAVYETLPTYRDALLPAQNMFSTVVASPVDILITDPMGRRVGAVYQDGIFIGEVNEISNIAAYTGRGTEPEFIAITDPLEGYYSVEIFGTESGTYDMNITRVINDTPIYKEEQEGVEIVENETQHYDFLIDDTPPSIQEVTVDPIVGGLGSLFTISAKVSDTFGVSTAYAIVQRPDEANLTTIALIDSDGDGIYSGIWDSSGFSIGTYYLDVFASDRVGNMNEAENEATITIAWTGTVIRSPPKSPTTDAIDMTFTLNDISDYTLYVENNGLSGLKVIITGTTYEYEYRHHFKGDKTFAGTISQGTLEPDTYTVTLIPYGKSGAFATFIYSVQ